MPESTPYKIIDELGRGGMGVVYRAVEKSLNRPVALKVLPRHLGARTDLVERFKREAQIAATLNHPNIVTVYAIGEQDGHYYIAMELYGPHHQTVAQNHNNLGMVLQGLGDLQKAYEYYARARTINEQVYVTKHPKVAINLINLANILRSSNKLRKAECYYRRAVRILNNVYGENHSHTQQALRNITTVRAQTDSRFKVV